MSLQLVAGVFLVALPILLIAALVWGLGKRSDFYESILLSSGSALLSQLLYFKAYSVITGRSAFDAVWNTFRQIFTTTVNAGELLSMYHGMGLFKNFTTTGQLADYLIGQMRIAVPAFLLISSIVYGMFLFFIIRFIIKKMGHDVPVVPMFEEWTLSRGTGFGLMILILASFLGSLAGIPNFDVVQLTITVLISFLFTVLGLCVLWFFLKAGRVPSVIRWLLAILACLFLGFALPFLGMFDLIFRMRKNYRNKFILRK